MAGAGFIRIVACFGLCLVSFAAARPDGAPVSACESMQPSHRGIPPQAGQAPYTVTANANTFTNGQPITVRIEGPDYQGVLLQARASGSTKPLGSWINPPPNTRILECGDNPSGAVTHANTTPKTKDTTYTWMPPDSNCPNAITFVATAAESFTTFFVDLKSDAIQKDPAATCGSSGAVTSSPNTTSNWTSSSNITSNWTSISNTTGNWTSSANTTNSNTTSNWTSTTESPANLTIMKLTTTSSASTETLSTWMASLLLLLPGHLFLVLPNLF